MHQIVFPILFSETDVSPAKNRTSTATPDLFEDLSEGDNLEAALLPSKYRAKVIIHSTFNFFNFF